MKTIKYRQYAYGSGYTDEELQLPDECTIYEIYVVGIAHIMEDDTWTKAYLILSPTDNEELFSRITDNLYFCYITDVVITDSEIPIQDIEQAPKLDGIYSVTYSANKVVEKEIGDLIKNNEKVPEPLFDQLNQISSICKFRRFTKSGAEVAMVCFENSITKEEENCIDIITIKYSNLFWEKYRTGPLIGKMFREQVDKIYNKVIYG